MLRGILLLFMVAPLLALFYFIQTVELHELSDIKVITKLMLLAFIPPLRTRPSQELALRSPPPRQEFKKTIVAIGDLHGDYAEAIKVLKMSGVINEAGDWSGGVNFFVQAGDIMDRGDDTIALFNLMEKLRRQANEQGATMISLFGNHELMNLAGNWKDVSNAEIETFVTKQERWNRLSTGDIGNVWAKDYMTACRLPLHPVAGELNEGYSPPTHGADGMPPSVSQSRPVNNGPSHAALAFVHGGLAPGYPDLLPFPTRINQISKELVAALQHSGVPRWDMTVSQRQKELKKILSSEEWILLKSPRSPLWYRDWAEKGEDEHLCAEVDRVLANTGTRHMIMGHTINKKRIVSKCDGKIIVIDTGMSSAYKSPGVLSALSIEYTLVHTGIGEDGVNRWIESEIITPIYISGPAKPLFKSRRKFAGDLKRPTTRS